LLAVLGALACGVEDEPVTAPPMSAPRVTDWDHDVTRFRPAPSRASSRDPLAEQIEALQAIGYVAGSRPAEGTSAGVLQHDPAASFDGVNLAIAGHRAEASLFAMDGRELHGWQLPFERAFPGRVVPESAPGTGYWRRVHLLPDGSLLAIFEGRG